MPQTKGSRALTAWRTERSLSYASLASVIGVDTSAVFRWESGERTPGRRQAARVAQVTAGAVKPEDWDDAAATG